MRNIFLQLILLVVSALFLNSCAMHHCRRHLPPCPPCPPCDNYHVCIDHVDKYSCEDP